MTRINMEMRPFPDNDQKLEILFNTLSEPEKQVMRYISSGKTEKEISQSLGVSIKTIQSHKYNLSKNLEIHNIADIARIWMKFGDKPDPLNEEETLS